MNHNNQTGAALFTALIFLLILTLVGVTALRNSGLSERMSSNAQISQMAFQAAESAANRYKAEYSYNVEVTAPASESNDRNNVLRQYLPITAIPAAGAVPVAYFEYCLNNSTSLLDGYQNADGDTNFNVDVDCTGVFLDGAAVIAKNKVIYEDCGTLLTSCPGFSGDGDIQCHIFKLETTGTVAQTTAQTDQWVSVLGACL